MTDTNRYNNGYETMTDNKNLADSKNTAIGKYIVIEGLEGAGKTTARHTVQHILQQAGIGDIILTREPGGTPLAESIRGLILATQNDTEPLCDISELLLFYAARAQLVATVIRPALERGSWVIGDRHDLSTQAYQGGGRGIDKTRLAALRQVALGDFEPDVTLYLDIEPRLGLQRIQTRGQPPDRIEQETLDFFTRTRQRYLQLAAADPRIRIINATQPLQQVQQEITQQLTGWLDQLQS